MYCLYGYVVYSKSDRNCDFKSKSFSNKTQNKKSIIILYRNITARLLHVPLEMLHINLTLYYNRVDVYRWECIFEKNGAKYLSILYYYIHKIKIQFRFQYVRVHLFAFKLY